MVIFGSLMEMHISYMYYRDHYSDDRFIGFTNSKKCRDLYISKD